MTLLILAAGNGSRYGALKQFDTLGPNNEFIFEFSIYDALKNNFTHIVIVTKQENVDEIKQYFKQRIPKLIKVDVVAQKTEELPTEIKISIPREKPWGTAHAIWVTRNYIQNDFVVVNADDFYGFDTYKKAAHFIQNNTENQYGLISYALKDTLSKHGSVSRGICTVDYQGNLLNIEEVLNISLDNQVIRNNKTNSVFSGEEDVSMNFWICKPSIFKIIEDEFIQFLKTEDNINNGEIYIPKVIQNAIKRNQIKVKVIKTNSSWFGVTYVNDKVWVEKSLKRLTEEKKYHTPLWKI